MYVSIYVKGWRRFGTGAAVDPTQIALSDQIWWPEQNVTRGSTHSSQRKRGCRGAPTNISQMTSFNIAWCR